MAPDLIRCPGCGVKMDLSTFAIRPDQVICPRCSTRAAVPPLAPSPSAAGFTYPPAPAPFAASQQSYGAPASYSPSYISPSAYTAQVVASPSPAAYGAAPMSAPLMSRPLPTSSFVWPQNAVAPAPLGPGPQPAPAPQPAPLPAPQPAPLPPRTPAPAPAPTPASAPAPSAAPRSFSMPKGAAQQSRGSQPDPFADSSFFNASTAKSLTDGTAILPIDAKGNSEPLAFALIGLLSMFLLFPPIGLALCLTSLMMGGEERRRGLYNAKGAAARFFAVLGLLANIALLAAEVYLIVSWVSDPPAVLGFFL